ncbi:hypothetical protein PIB30_020252 [Stylosanthes scabra]|uniref:Uncharacterized protein n=1 Tax=Stylosanthes scabra TaxID=79078 RepID=A0ABU6U7D6_9FABA|nr:hypothetical protein [Stylosanthes scabra]
MFKLSDTAHNDNEISKQFHDRPFHVSVIPKMIKILKTKTIINKRAVEHIPDQFTDRRRCAPDIFLGLFFNCFREGERKIILVVKTSPSIFQPPQVSWIR